MPNGLAAISKVPVECWLQWVRSLSLEPANGRLAMVAIMGQMFQGSTFGTAGQQVWLPGSAFGSELGVQAPVGFWDPMGFCKDGDVDDFKRRRETELKHGRVARYAAMGFITPEYFKFPGYLSPSAGLKFEDVPSGLAAISKVPVEGWPQWVALCGLYEIVANKPNASEPGNYGVVGEDPAKRSRSLSPEDANIRLVRLRSGA